MDRTALESRLQDDFDAGESAAEVVARQARDLADAGLYASDFDHELTVEIICSNLDDAPDEYALVKRWNWWLGALELSHGDYEQFSVRPESIDERR